MFRNVEIIIYNLEDLRKVISKVEVNNDIEYAYCLHDKDEGKKPHYHFRIFAKNKKSLVSWSNFLECEIHDIEILQYKKLSIRYLIHKDNPEKFQYDITNIVSNFPVEPYFKDNISEEEQLSLIIQYINDNQYFRLIDLFNYCLENGLWSAYRRNYSILRDIYIQRLD